MLSLSAFTTTVVPSALVAVITPVPVAEELNAHIATMAAESVTPVSFENLFIVLVFDRDFTKVVIFADNLQ